MDASKVTVLAGSYNKSAADSYEVEKIIVPDSKEWSYKNDIAFLKVLCPVA